MPLVAGRGQVVSYPLHHKGLFFHEDGTRSLAEGGVCSLCAAELPEPLMGRISVGYAVLDGKKVCYACCAKLEEQDMYATGRAVLYFSRASREGALLFKKDGATPLYFVTNWPGTLVFEASRVKKAHHNWHNVTRYDVWFTDGQGCEWHGINLGDNEILRCKRKQSKKGMQHGTRN